MKKNSIFGVAFMIMSLHQLAAQDSAQVSPSVSKQFEETFPGSKNMHWTFLPKEISEVKFLYDGKSWLAYFDADGNIITSGRRIKAVADLPLRVQSGFERAKSRFEKKSGPSQVGTIYEMVKNDITKYYITLQSAATRALLSVSTDGLAIFESKTPVTKDPVAPKKDAIARKD